ncbi:MAG: putative endonuclease [Parcubacteria group bacterium Athens0714_16]|nr:MAG: putative endonuclease [Parcubacteria group bacterium Athens0714_16]
MNRTHKRYIGDIGENVACNFLKKKGFSVVGRNYNKKWGEIDIITKKKKDIHFVEVKTISRNLNVSNRGDDEYRAEENVHPWKLKRLNRAIESYLEENNISDDVEWALDLVVVYLDLENKKAKVEYLDNIF